MICQKKNLIWKTLLAILLDYQHCCFFLPIRYKTNSPNDWKIELELNLHCTILQMCYFSLAKTVSYGSIKYTTMHLIMTFKKVNYKIIILAISANENKNQT